MIDHVSLGTTRYPDAVAFYARVLAPLGLSLVRDTGAEAGFGTPERWGFFLYPVDDGSSGSSVAARGMHLAFGASSRAQVEAAHAAAMAAGATDLWAPRARPDISDRYYGAMFQDLDGHRIEIAARSASGAPGGK